MCWKDCTALDEYRDYLDRRMPFHAALAELEALHLLGLCVVTGQSLTEVQANLEAAEAKCAAMEESYYAT